MTQEGPTTMNESDDITPLVRKIAKCDRLLKKPSAPGSNNASTTSSKLQKKRTEYLLQLGEMAYRAALASPMMLAAGPSPTTVTEKLDSSNFAQFHDSLAVFEHPSLVNGHEETDDTQPYNPTLLVVEDKDEKQEQDEAQEKVQLKMPATTVRASRDLRPSDETTTIATSSEVDAPPSAPFDEEGNDDVTNLEAVVTQEKMTTTTTDQVTVGDELKDLKNKDDLTETLDTDVPDDESIDFLQSTTAADTVEQGVTVAAVSAVSANLGDPISIHSVDTNASEPKLASSVSIPSPSTSSSKGSVFDGEGSVSKLRAMFDSPAGEKPRRSWRPKRVFDAIPPAPLATSEDSSITKPVPSTVTMRVQVGSDQPQAVITLLQAVMTSSVHDIDSPLVALVSLFPESLHEYMQKQNRALLIFNALGIEPQYVDGSNPLERARRDELFRLSGKRGVYPQLFVRKQGKLEFFADFDRIELLNDCDTLKEELEAACQ